MPKITIAVIADAHAGHPAAIWPSYFKTPKGNTIRANRAQGVLLEYWKDFWGLDQIRSAKYVLNLAESVEGYNKKEHGDQILTSNLDWQALAFTELLGPYISGKKYLGVYGSKYHDSEDLLIEKAIASEFKGDFYEMIAQFQVGGRIIFAAHDMTDALLYKSTGLDRNSLFTDAIEGPWDHNKVSHHIDIVASGHCHQFFLNQNESRITFISPCWKFWHPIRKYGAKKWAKIQPSIGGCWIEIDPDEKTCAVKVKTYPIKHVYDRLVRL
jgi:hypothetical protein